MASDTLLGYEPASHGRVPLGGFPRPSVPFLQEPILLVGLYYRLRKLDKVSRELFPDAQQRFRSVLLPEAQRHLAAHEDSERQEVLDASDVYLNGQEFGLALNARDPFDVEALPKPR